jgi:hypothetical protein
MLKSFNKRWVIVIPLVIFCVLLLIVTFFYLGSHSAPLRGTIGEKEPKVSKTENIGKGKQRKEKSKELKKIVDIITSRKIVESTFTTKGEVRSLREIYGPPDKELKKSVAQISWKYTPIFLEQILSEEEEDPVWTEMVEKEIEKLSEEGEFKGTEFMDVKCGETLCKIVQIHEDEGAFELFQERPGGPWIGVEGHGTSSQLDNGKIQSSFYFSKDDDNIAFDESILRMGDMMGLIDIKPTEDSQ